MMAVIDRSTIISALSYVPANDRDLWLKIGMAIKSELSDNDGLEVWSEWSQSDESYSERDARAVWRGIKPNGGVSIGTLFHYAKSNGWQDDGKVIKQTADQIKQRKTEHAEKAAAHQAIELAKHEAGARKATDIYSKAVKPDGIHAYLHVKGIKPDAQLRVYQGDLSINGMACAGALIVPLRDGTKNLTTLQFISESGEKRFLPDGRKQGCYSSLGGTPDTVLLISEGYATGASLHQATGYPVAIAFDAGNLEAVGKALRDKLPGICLVFCADNDRFKEAANTGIEKATQAAQVVSGRVAIPVFKTENNKATDFNDLHQIEGLEAVKAQIEAVLTTRPEPAKEVDSFEDAVIRLAGLSLDQYDRLRKSDAIKLGVQVRTLDNAVKAVRNKERENNDHPFDEVEPWPNAIDPAALLSEIESTIRRFIICEPETSHAAALWAAMTWFMDVVQVAPLAVITAPEKRCGKSQLLFLLARTTCKPLPASNITPAALFRSIDKWQPTLLIDEADAFMRENEELRGLLNCGHTRESAFSIRTVGDDHTPTRFNLWGAKALAGIGHLADTLMDRAITLELRRKMPNEKVDKLRYVETELFSVICQKLARFAIDYSETIRAARPELPAALHDRAQDNWEPLLAIADAAGGVWPEQARKAAMKLSGEIVQTQSHGAELLADIQEVFQSKKVARMFSDDLTGALCEDSEKPWSTYNRGKPITPKQVAIKLKDYSICSKSVRIDYANRKGYELTQFLDAFARYLSDPSENSVFPVTASQSNTHAGLAVTISNVTNLPVTQIVTRKPNAHAGCDAVTGKNGILGNSANTHLNSDLTVDI